MSLPTDVDKTRWSPAEDRRGNPVQPGDYVSVPVYPRGTVRGTLEVSDRAWAVLPGGAKVQALVVLADNGTRYEATSKIRKLTKPKP